MLAARALDTRGWASWAGRWAAMARCHWALGWRGPHCGDLRRQPRVVDVIGRDGPGARTARRLRGQLRGSGWRASRSDRLYDSDPFYLATKQFIAQLPNGAVGGFSQVRVRRDRSGLRSCRSEILGWPCSRPVMHDFPRSPRYRAQNPGSQKYSRDERRSPGQTRPAAGNSGQ